LNNLFPSLCVNFPCKTDVLLREIALIDEKIFANLVDTKFLEVPGIKTELNFIMGGNIT